MQIKQRRLNFHVAADSVCVPCNQSHPGPLLTKDGKLVRLVIVKCRRSFFVFFRERDPGLYHFEAACQGRWILKSFRMCNPSAGGHPVYLARSNNLLYTQTITMRHLSAKKITYRRQPDMRVGQNIKR